MAFSFSALVLFISISASLGWGRPYFSYLRNVPMGDKMMHFILFGLLSFFCNLAFPSKQTNISKYQLLPISILLIVIVSIDEFSQIWLVRRSFDLRDLFCNYLGIFVFQKLATYVLQRRTNNRKAVSV